MTSAASDEPPPVSMRKTTARTFGSRRASSKAFAIVREPAMRERILAQAAVPATLSGFEFSAFLQQQHELWGKVVRLSGTRLD